MLQQHRNILETEMFCHNFAKIKSSEEMSYNLGTGVEAKHLPLTNMLNPFQ